jgi:hypothetical protein
VLKSSLLAPALLIGEGLSSSSLPSQGEDQPKKKRRIIESDEECAESVESVHEEKIKNRGGGKVVKNYYFNL